MTYTLSATDAPIGASDTQTVAITEFLPNFDDYEGPPIEFGTPIEVFQAALEHEQAVTRSIHELFRIAGE